MFKNNKNWNFDSRNWKTNGTHADIVEMENFIKEGYNMFANGCSFSEATGYTSLLMGRAGFSNEEIKAYCNSCHENVYEGVKLGETNAQIQERIKEVVIQSLAYLVKCCERFNSGEALVSILGFYLENENAVKNI